MELSSFFVPFRVFRGHFFPTTAGYASCHFPFLGPAFGRFVLQRTGQEQQQVTNGKRITSFSANATNLQK
jgi:hypothetical protein